MSTRHRALFVTLPGLAPWCAEELRELGLDDAEARSDGGGAWVDATVQDAGELARACWLSRLAVRGVWLLDDFAIGSDTAALESLRDRIASLGDAVARWIPPGRTFAGRSTRSGAHAFGSVELEQMTGAGAYRAARAVWGADPKVNLTDPDVTIRTDVVGDRAVMGIDFVGKRGMDRRPTPGPHHTAGCSPIVAAALLRFTGWSAATAESGNDGEVLCDPMCGGGTIVVEALSIAAGLPAGWWRRGTLAFERLQDPDGAPMVDPGLTAGPRPASDLRPTIIAADAAGRALELAQGAVVEAGFPGGAVEFHRCDIADLAGTLAAHRVARVVVNPPYGIKMGNRRSLKHAYAGLAKFMRDALTNEGRAAAILPGPGRLQRPLKAAGLRSEVVATVQLGEIAAGVVVVRR